jgi:hypothetical protein
MSFGPVNGFEPFEPPRLVPDRFPFLLPNALLKTPNHIASMAIKPITNISAQ